MMITAQRLRNLQNSKLKKRGSSLKSKQRTMATSPQHTIPPLDDDLFGISSMKSEAEEPCEIDFDALDEVLKQFDFPEDLDEYLSLEPSQSQKVDHCTDDIDDFAKELEEYAKSLKEPSHNEKVDHCTTEKVVDEILFNAKDELSKDSVVPCNEVSSPVSIDHCTTEKVVDITFDVTHSKLNIMLPSNKNRGRWSKEEHRLFLIGLERYGNGRWKDISEHVVPTRTKQQVASHAQKYFLSKNASKEKKKRKSIYDMTLPKVEARVLPKIDQQNCCFTPGSATLPLPQEVQQLSYSMPHQMRGVEYLEVDPHYIQQQNWVPSPIQPYPRKVYDISSLFSPNPMSGYRYVNNEFLNGRSHGMTRSKQTFF